MQIEKKIRKIQQHIFPILCRIYRVSPYLMLIYFNCPRRENCIYNSISFTCKPVHCYEFIYAILAFPVYHFKFYNLEKNFGQEIAPEKC